MTRLVFVSLLLSFASCVRAPSPPPHAAAANDKPPEKILGLELYACQTEDDGAMACVYGRVFDDGEVRHKCRYMILFYLGERILVAGHCGSLFGDWNPYQNSL